MAITLKRQLTPEEKTIILQRHGRVCFATGHAIPEQDSLHFDHVLAFALGGRSELDNIAPMCEMHNKAKGVLPLEDFRVKLRLQEFFSGGDSLTLKHLLAYLKKSGDIGEDDEKRTEAEVQKITDRHIHELENVQKSKEAELLEV